MGAVVSSITNVPNSYYGNFRYNAALGIPQHPELRPEHRGDGRGLRRLRSRELVPGDPERRRPGDHPLVPPAGRSSATTRRTASTTGREPTRPATGPIRRRGSSGRWPQTAMTRRPSPTSYPTRPQARSPSTSITTPMASPIRSGSTWVTRPGPMPSGRLSKPLFAFLVIGLNGRIPLNTRRQPGRHGRHGCHPRRAPRQLGQRARPDLCLAERQPGPRD